MRRWLNHPDGCARPGELGLSYPFGGPQEAWMGEPWALDTPALPGAEMPSSAFQQPNTFLDSLPGYNASEAGEMNLEWARVLSEADRYISRIVTFPAADNVPGSLTNPAPGITFANGETKRGSFAIPPYSFLLSIAMYATDNDNVKQGPPGPIAVWLRLFDKGANVDLFSGQYAMGPTQAGDNSHVNDFGAIPQEPYGPYWLWSPHSVAPPGSFEWAITNVGVPQFSAPRWVQFALQFAVPLTVENLGVTTDASQKVYAALPKRPETPGGF